MSINAALPCSGFSSTTKSVVICTARTCIHKFQSRYILSRPPSRAQGVSNSLPTPTQAASLPLAGLCGVSSLCPPTRQISQASSSSNGRLRLASTRFRMRFNRTHRFAWGNAADYELMRAVFPLANLFKSRDHEHALLDLANGYCSAAVLTPPAWQVSLLYLLPRTAPFLPTPVHLLLSSLTPSEHVALPRLLPCTQLRISLPGAASLVLIYSRHACHSHDANNQVLQKRQKRSLNPQFLTLIRYHSHRSLGASKNSTATAPCSTWGDQCIR